MDGMPKERQCNTVLGYLMSFSIPHRSLLAYTPVRQTVGWPLFLWREESPGSTETRCRVTPGGGDPRDSATERKPPAAALATAGKGERVR